MLSLFLNPYSMIAGVALVGSPIIIHLINRMRYRRVKWAAMEFLLKSQKRNRRRLIIEQLILLLLRILLVLLIGLLLARLVSDALALARPQGSLHVVALDDTASMGDAWRADGQAKTTFEAAKKAVVEEIVKGAIQARTPQALELFRLSAPDDVFRVDRLNDTSVAEIEAHLAGLKPSALHIGPQAGIAKARELFDRTPNAKHVLHLVGDFRARDWTGGPSEALTLDIGQLTGTKGAGGAKVFLIDVADPPRSPTQKAALDHGNVGVLDLQPETRVAARFMPAEFTITVANFSPVERKNVRVTVRVNGQERADSSTTIPSVPPGVTQTTFTALFDQLGLAQVTATLEAEEAGLALDNTRYAAVEVREKVPMLFVEGDVSSRGKAESDAFYLRALFLDAAKGFDVVSRGVQELEQPNLDQYPAIFLLNVARLNDKSRANLDAYIKGGGGVCFCMGNQIDSGFYNRLYADGSGVFPVPLADRPTPPMTDAQKMERTFDPALPPKLFTRGDTHPILARLYREDRNREANTYLKFLLVDQYFPVPRALWNPAPGTTDELLTLPNYRSLDDYKEDAQRLLNEIPVDKPENAAYQAQLKNHQRKVKDVLANGQALYQLANAVEAMLTEPADAKDPAKADLRAYWQQPANLELAEKFGRLLDSTRYGDPLLVAKRYGKGRVLAYLTTAGNAWNDFPNGPARPFFVMLMLEMQKYLAGVGTDANRLVGSPYAMTLDAKRFGAKMRRSFLPDAGNDGKPANAVDLGEQVGAIANDKVSFPFSENKRPGIYRFDFAPASEAAAAAPVRTESVAVAFNVDTANEGDLRRAARDELESAAPGAALHAPGSGLADLLKEKRTDLSESPWLFLALLVILLAEQAMAVRLSYHLGGNEVASAVNLGTRTNG